MTDKPSCRVADNAEWLEWYQMTPAQRWQATDMLWDFYLSTGGSLDPQPDTQSPFYAAFTSSKIFAYWRPGVHIVRRC